MIENLPGIQTIGKFDEQPPCSRLYLHVANRGELVGLRTKRDKHFNRIPRNGNGEETVSRRDRLHGHPHHMHAFKRRRLTLLSPFPSSFSGLQVQANTSHCALTNIKGTTSYTRKTSFPSTPPIRPLQPLPLRMAIVETAPGIITTHTTFSDSSLLLRL